MRHGCTSILLTQSATGLCRITDVRRPAADGLIPGTGHFHIDVDTPPIDEGEVIPFDDAHKHYGKGQTAVDLELAPVRVCINAWQLCSSMHARGAGLLRRIKAPGRSLARCHLRPAAAL